MNYKKLYKRGVTGILNLDSKTLVFVERTAQRGDILHLLSDIVGGKDVEIQVGKFELMQLSDDYARAWCGSDKCRCSPPIGGNTCHHCANPYPDDRDNTGSEGYLFKVPDNIEIDGKVKVVKDFRFNKPGIVSALMAIGCRLFDSDFCNYGTLKFDYAKLEYGAEPPDLQAYSAVIFAGINRGPYAVAYPFENLPQQYRPVRYVHPKDANQLKAMVIHCDEWGGKWSCPTIVRMYKYAGTGMVFVGAYNNVYTFTDVVFLKADDIPLNVTHNGETKTITWAVQPGYSGGVVYVPA